MKKKSTHLSTTAEIIMHTPSPLMASLRNYKPQTVTPLKYKKKFQDSYKKELQNYHFE